MPPFQDSGGNREHIIPGVPSAAADSTPGYQMPPLRGSGQMQANA